MQPRNSLDFSLARFFRAIQGPGVELKSIDACWKEETKWQTEEEGRSSRGLSHW
jgi:hypothetical protein